MNYIKIDINRNNSILEISGTNFNDLATNEIEIQTNYDFPTGQKLYFYRWNDVVNKVEINDEDVIRSFYEENGVLSGLELEPYIENVIGGDFLPETTKIITIEGINFSPFSVVEISGTGNFVNTTYFDSPKQLRAEITVNREESIHDLTVKNNDLHSHDSGYNRIVIKSRTTIDLRTTPIGNLGLEMTNGVFVQQNSEKGIRFYAYTSSWNRGVKLTSYFWNRNDEITFEIIFTKVSDTNFMIGIGSSSLNVNYINSAYYKQEIGMFHNNNKLSSIYGGGDVSNWSQGIGKTIIFDNNKFYKFKLENSGGNGARCSILEVEDNNWDNETELHAWISSCPADDVILMPFILPQASSGSYYITGFRF